MSMSKSHSSLYQYKSHKYQKLFRIQMSCSSPCKCLTKTMPHYFMSNVNLHLTKLPKFPQQLDIYINPSSIP